MWAKKDYITYESSSPVPEIDTSVRQRSRYGGVGVTAGDEWADFFSDPDEPPAERAEAVLAAAELTSESPDEPAIGPVTDAAAELAVEKAAEPAVDPVVETVDEPAADPIVESVTEPADEPAAEPAADQTVEPITEPAAEEPSSPCASKRFASKRPIDEGMRASDVAAFANEPLEPAKFSQFRNVYESRDGKLCVFEDESGHLVAVNAARLA